MKVYGFDFTRAPSARKPITCADCRLEEGHLCVEAIFELPMLDQFQEALCRGGEWIAGVDFPFGQPRKLVETFGWPPSWEHYVAGVGAMTKGDFEDALRDYCRCGQGRHRGLSRPRVAEGDQESGL